MRRWRCVFAGAFWLGLASAACAQGPVTVPLKALVPHQPIGSVQAALKTLYGEAVLAKMAQSLAATAAVACKADRKLTDESFRALVAQLLVAVETSMNEKFKAAINAEKANALFEQRVPPASLARYRELMGNRGADGIFPVYQALADGGALDRTSKSFARALLLNRVDVAKPLFAQEDGDVAVLKLAEAIGAAFDGALAKLPMPDLTVIGDISTAAVLAFDEATNVPAFLALSQHNVMPAIQPLLEAHCIPVK